MIRWIRMGRGFKSYDFKAHLVTDRRRNARSLRGLSLKSPDGLKWEEYDAVKVCYQASIDLVPPHPNLIVRMCRVVDEHRPKRDDGRRAELMRQQQRISEIASAVAFNDTVNAERWKSLYGKPEQVLIVPTGCPSKIPDPQDNPFPQDKRIVLFCGSITSHRFPNVLNRLAHGLRKVRPDVEVHLVGRDRLVHYAGDSEPLDKSVVHCHDPVDEKEAWQYILHADVGVALAPSGDEFESELSKIYYYLRGGLPAVTESVVPNRGVIEDASHGTIAGYDDPEDLVRKTLEAMELPARNPDVMQHMVDHHSWVQRAGIYVAAIDRNSAVHGDVVVRIDDVRCLSERLENVWRVLESHGVPVHLETIPFELDPRDVEKLVQRARRSKSPAFFHQHGYRHVNHGTDKRRFEFSDDRSPSEQREDIVAGRQILQRAFGELFEPIFTPPWDRLGTTTLGILAEEQFVGVSVIDTSSAPEHAALPRVSMTTDPVKWRPEPVHRPWNQTRREVAHALAQRGYAGIELHHDVMDEDAVAGLDQLLTSLRGASWPTMRSIAERG